MERYGCNALHILSIELHHHDIIMDNNVGMIENGENDGAEPRK
jgi:hypothetical protein